MFILSNKLNKETYVGFSSDHLIKLDGGAKSAVQQRRGKSGGGKLVNTGSRGRFVTLLIKYVYS